MKPPRSRRVRRGLAGLLVVGAAVTAIVIVVQRDEPEPAAAAEIFKTAAITSGTLSTTEKIDGSVELSTTLTVLHRIEGQESSADTTPTDTSSAANQSAAPTQFGQSATPVTGLKMTGLLKASVLAAQSTASDCATPGTPTGPTTPTTPTTTDASVTTDTPSTDGSTGDTTPTTEPPATTTPDCTPPDSTTPDTSTASTIPTSDDTSSTINGPGGGQTNGGPSGAIGGAGGGGSLGGRTSTGGSSSSSTRITQTVTSVTAAGTAIGLGDVLYTVESQPVVALSGTLPAWRSLSTSVDDGPDVQQLESSLVSLGYDPDGKVTVDNHFDSSTKAMVKRWQFGLGVEQTGEVALGSVVFLPDPTTVTSVSAAVGDAVGDGDTILDLADATQQVVIQVPDGAEASIVPGLQVQLGSNGATGTVTILRSTERDDAVVVDAVIAPDAPLENVANGSTIKVTVTTDNVDGVLIVPAEALLSKLDGSYAVQVRNADNTVTWYTVDVVSVSDSKVGISGTGLSEGMNVLLPV